MAISQDEQKPATEPQGSPATPTRSGNKQVMKTTSPWRDEDADPQEYAALLDLYDNSFRNLAEGEVVKGTVLKVTANEVVIDVGYKSEGVIPVDEFLDETGQVIFVKETWSTCCSSAPKTAKATSCCRARRPRR